MIQMRSRTVLVAGACFTFLIPLWQKHKGERKTSLAALQHAESTLSKESQWGNSCRRHCSDLGSSNADFVIPDQTSLRPLTVKEYPWEITFYLETAGKGNKRKMKIKRRYRWAQNSVEKSILTFLLHIHPQKRVHWFVSYKAQKHISWLGPLKWQICGKKEKTKVLRNGTKFTRISSTCSCLQSSVKGNSSHYKQAPTSISTVMAPDFQIIF